MARSALIAGGRTFLRSTRPGGPAIAARLKSLRVARASGDDVAALRVIEAGDHVVL